MSYRDKARWGVLERWSATAFAAAGVLSLATAALFGVETLMNSSYPGWVTGIFGLSALIASFIGLGGLYPRLVEQVPRLARTGITTIVIAGIALIAFPLCLFAKTSGVDLHSLPIIVFIIAMVSIIGGFSLFGIATLRAQVPSRTVGLLILATVVTYMILFVGDMVFNGSPGWLNFAMSGIQALFLLAIGYILPSSILPSESNESQIATISG